MKKPDWHLALPEESRPDRPIRFDYVLPISARLGNIEKVKDIFIRVHRDLNPNFAGNIDYGPKIKHMIY